MIELIAPGDIYVAEKQTLQFHKGMSYEIRNVYHKGGKLIATITDKWGKEVFFLPQLFKTSSKTHANQCLRHLSALLEFWFNTNGTFTYWKGWRNPSPYYQVSSNVVYSGSGKNTEGSVRTEMKFRNEMNIPWETVSTEPKFDFHSKSECIDHFFGLLKNSINEDFYAIHLEGLDSKVQDQLNRQTYILMNGINTIPKDKLDELSKTIIDNGYNYQGRHYGHLDLTFDEYVTYLNELIFDNKISDKECKERVQQVIKLYVVAPSSYAATAISKILLGKGKINNSNLQPYWNIFTTFGIKQEVIFEFADKISTYLYHTGIFKTKEDYSSGTEWRGAFEFIGSKYIDKVKLEEFLK